MNYEVTSCRRPPRDLARAATAVSRTPGRFGVHLGFGEIDLIIRPSEVPPILRPVASHATVRRLPPDDPGNRPVLGRAFAMNCELGQIDRGVSDSPTSLSTAMLLCYSDNRVNCGPTCARPTSRLPIVVGSQKKLDADRAVIIRDDTLHILCNENRVGRSNCRGRHHNADTPVVYSGSYLHPHHGHYQAKSQSRSGLLQRMIVEHYQAESDVSRFTPEDYLLLSSTKPRARNKEAAKTRCGGVGRNPEAREGRYCLSDLSTEGGRYNLSRQRQAAARRSGYWNNWFCVQASLLNVSTCKYKPIQREILHTQTALTTPKSKEVFLGLRGKFLPRFNSLGPFSHILTESLQELASDAAPVISSSTWSLSIRWKTEP
ncbi:hypothetical protein J6590_026753 [Homalodisca vitripennis]|nr:hypothetical protein J6590_026753 [Homalodisca vitripennis]